MQKQVKELDASYIFENLYRHCKDDGYEVRNMIMAGSVDGWDGERFGMLGLLFTADGKPNRYIIQETQEAICEANKIEDVYFVLLEASENVEEAV